MVRARGFDAAAYHPPTAQIVHYGAARAHHPDSATAAPNGGSGRVREAAVHARRRSSGALCPEQSGRGSQWCAGDDGQRV